ncbi:MAG: hypothetical protein ACK40V_02820 [Anaerolineales bacterium]
MNSNPIFSPFWTFTNSPIDYFLFALFAIFLILIFTLQTQKRNIKGYSPRLAWIRGGIYFASCFILSIFTGVFQTLISKPIAASENFSNIYWWIFTFVCAVVIYIAYFIIWRRGTLTHGRELHIPSVLTFGLLWGLSEGQLILSVWAIVEKFVSNIWFVALVSFLIISAFKGLWQSQYWDIYVSPEHNIPEWNLRKVLLGHIPNLMFTLTYLAIFGNAFIFLLFQTTGLMICTYYMHFPKWTVDERP